MMLKRILPQRGIEKCIQAISNSPRKLSTEENDAIIQDIGDKGIIILNRPKAMNSFSTSMIDQISSTLLKWEKEKRLVILKGNGGKAFSAGGNIKLLAQAPSKGDNLWYEALKSVYKNHGIVGELKIPCISFIDGIVMGGGVGLSVLGSYRVATERTVLALPETQIGLFPDAGGTYILSRLDERLGWYMALTGARLKGADVFKTGLATHYTDSTNLPSLEEALLQCSNKDDIKNTLNKFQKEDTSEFSLAPYAEKIKHCFSAPTTEEIYARLEKDGSDWAEDTIKTLNKMSPTSLKITHKGLQLSKDMNLLESLRMEYRMSVNCIDSYNFKEGVRALLVDKSQNPKWQPATLQEVTDEIVDSYFKKPSGQLDSKYELFY